MLDFDSPLYPLDNAAARPVDMFAEVDQIAPVDRIEEHHISAFVVEKCIVVIDRKRPGSWGEPRVCHLWKRGFQKIAPASGE